MPVHRTLTTYLELTTPPCSRLPAPQRDIWVTRAWRPSPGVYRSWYSRVGGRHYWVDRLIMPTEELQMILDDDRVEVWLLRDHRDILGYAELDRRHPPDIELAYFGLFPEAIGRGLGKFLLNWIIHRAWSYTPRRLWVHTCDLDHPAALPNYQQAGFQVYNRRVVEQWLPESLDTPPSTPEKQKID